MKVFGFVRQPSAAKFIMLDIMHAFRRLNWEYDWLDMEKWKEETVKLPPERRRGSIDGLIERIKKFSPDIIVSYGIEAFYPLFSDIDDSIKHPFFSYFEDIPFLCFFFDFGSPFTDPGPIESIPFINQMQGPQCLFLCWDRDAIKVMKNKGISKCLYFPMGVNEEIFKMVKPDEPDMEKYKSDFCFIGGPTPLRIEILETIYDKHLKIYGYDEQKWNERSLLKPFFQHPVYNQEELVKIYNSSLAAVNVTREHGKSSLNMRVYEAMACGSLLLTDDKEDARELFSPDNEIMVYKDKNDFKEKSDWIVKNRKRARDIALNGRVRILEEHTYLKRVQNLIPVIERFIAETSELWNITARINKKDYREARDNIDKIMKRGNPLNADFLYHIESQIALSQGRMWAAKQSLEKSLEINPNFLLSLEAKAKLR